MNLLIHISAYKQVDLIEKNILNFRNNFSELKYKTIITTSTAPEDPGFGALTNKYDNLVHMQFDAAPGNPDVIFKSRPQQYPSWRAEFIAPRILLPIQKVLQIASIFKYDSVLHMHSDSFWKPESERQLLNEIDTLLNKNKLFIGDLSAPCEGCNAIPKGFHFQPEGLLFNVAECHKYGYGIDFWKIWEPESGFISHNWMAIEAFFGQFAHWCLTGKNITAFTDEVDEIYFERVVARCQRDHHGNFAHIYNPPGEQH